MGIKKGKKQKINNSGGTISRSGGISGFGGTLDFKEWTDDLYPSAPEIDDPSLARHDNNLGGGVR